MTYIYADVLVLLNVYMNYFLLRLTARLTHRQMSRRRGLLASLLGGVYALTMLLPELPAWLLFLGRAFLTAALVRIGFGRLQRREWIRLCACLLGVSTLLSGILFTYQLLLHPAGMLWSNGIVYLDFSLLTLVLGTCVAYGLLTVLQQLHERRAALNGRYQIIIRQKGQSVALEGLADTGNILVDAFSGKSVIICGRNQLRGLTKLTDAGGEPFAGMQHLRGFRFLPYTAVGGNGVLPVFLPDEVVIFELDSRRSKRVDALIGLGDTTQAIFHPRLLDC